MSNGNSPQSRRQFIKKTLGLSAVAIATGYGLNAAASTRDRYLDASENGKNIVREAIVLDALLATPWGLGWTKEEQFHEYMERGKQAGITAYSITVASTDFTWDDMIFQITKHLGVMGQHPERYMVCRTVRDIRECHETNRIGILFNAQSAEFVQYDYENLLIARELGLKQVNLTYNNSSSYGDGGYVENGRGLTKRGFSIVDFLHQSSMVVDGSHSSTQMGLNIARHTLDNWPGKPMIYSHSNALGMYEHPRNITDEQIELCAQTNGVVNVCLYNLYMNLEPGEAPTGDDCANHVDYIVQKVGIDHVGLATDDSYIVEPMEAYANANPQIVDDPHMMRYTRTRGTRGAELAKSTPAIVDSLIDKGYSDSDCRKVLGENMMRVYSTVWGG